jgi:hypothetical protein
LIRAVHQHKRDLKSDGCCGETRDTVPSAPERGVRRPPADVSTLTSVVITLRDAPASSCLVDAEVNGLDDWSQAIQYLHIHCTWDTMLFEQ